NLDRLQDLLGLIVLHEGDDVQLAEFHRPPVVGEGGRGLRAGLADAPKARSTRALLPSVTIGQQRLDSMLKVLDVDGAVRRVTGGWE
ncbi:MAG: hypothetical protein ACQSGP_09245, partial [Frankia sp.]